MIGKILGNRYEIVERIGSGGMAVVYKAKCRLLNRYVAVKILRDELKDDKDFVEKFKAEAQSAASLTHPNIVSVFDVGEQDGLYYFVMEYIEGVTLKEIVTAKGVLDWKVVAEFALGICYAIENAHKKGIVHRDIKPLNIMINGEGSVKVTDFGIARAVSSSTLVRGGNIIGSVHYFSPEQAQGGSIDYKSDIYSIGIVLYEMLTGRVPFNSETPFGIAKMHVDTQAIAPKVIKPLIPQIMNDITMKAIAKNPQDRYQNVGEFITDLKHALNGGKESISNLSTEATQWIPQVTPTAPIEPKDKVIVSEKANDGTSKSKDKKAVVWAWITGLLVLCIALVGAVFVINPNIFIIGDTAPKLVGMTIEDAKAKYQNSKFTIIEGESQYNEEYQKGTIMEQDPKEREKVQLPAQINVIVSLGKKDIVLKNYIGIDYEVAKTELELMGLSVEVKFESDPNAPRNTVYKHSPAEKSQMNKGEKVTLYVSNGPDIKIVKVPNIVGMKELDATDKIRSVGLNPGNITFVEADIEKGRIVKQTPSASQDVDEGSEVSFEVSKGPAIVATSDPSIANTPSSLSTPPAATAKPTQ